LESLRVVPAAPHVAADASSFFRSRDGEEGRRGRHRHVSMLGTGASLFSGFLLAEKP
jgi:hypothetical protein